MNFNIEAASKYSNNFLHPSILLFMVMVLLDMTGCAVGPNYHRPTVQIPDHFKEAVEWRRAQPGTNQSLHDNWWHGYNDKVLDQLVERALKANQSIASAEAAYRVAQAAVKSSVAALYPTVSGNLAGTRNKAVAGVSYVPGGSTGGAFYNLSSLNVSASWEPDLWGSVRRSIEASRANAQASDAELAGVRLSISAGVVADYIALRQADADIDSLNNQRDVNARILSMVQASMQNGEASNDQVLAAKNNLEANITALQITQALREQDEHALAALLGLPPAAFSLPAQPDYKFVVPTIPPMVPSQLLLRRYDVVSAERTAAAANARIGVAEAAFFPNFMLSAQDGFENRSFFSQLLSISNNMWTLGPTLAATLFDGGARDAAVASARATYDEDVAIYRNTVIGALQGVEDSLSTMNHAGEQASAQARVLQNNERLYASAEAQRKVGAASEQDLLGARLTLLQARQSLVDVRAELGESSVTLIKNLGGGWQQGAAGDSPASIAATSTLSGSHP